MTLSSRYVGIDVSKAMLDVFDEGTGVAERIANAPEAIAALTARWRCAEVFVVFEATGVYDRALTRALSQAGIGFARVNPARARSFARASGRLAKTDAIDARMLAAFGRTLPLSADAPRSAARDELAFLAKRRDQLVLMRTQEKNRRGHTADADMRESIARVCELLTAEIEMVEARVEALIEAAPDIAEQARLIRSVPGIGAVACMQLLAQMPELGRTGPKQVAALAGLAPINIDSGAYRGRRAIGGGRKRVRDALYMAALNAVRRADRFKAFYQKLRDAGKPGKLALIAVARKLLTTLNAMLRDNQTYRKIQTS